MERNALSGKLVSKKNKFKRWIKKEEKKTARESHRKLSQGDLMALIYFSIVVAILQVSGMLLNMHTWATTNPDFGSYNFYAPFVALCGWTGYVYVLFMKRVHAVSLLPYVPAVVGLFYNIVLTLIRWEYLDPTLLKLW